MDTNKPLLGALLNKQIRYEVPIFQRHYVWGETFQWQPLWEDIQHKIGERIEGKKHHPHYTGSIVLKQASGTTSTLQTFYVIDGQQRLTTFQLLLIALREVSKKHSQNNTIAPTINNLIINNIEQSFGVENFEEQKYKLNPTKFDAPTFKDIVILDYTDFHKKYLQPILDEYGIGKKTYKAEASNRNSIIGAYLFFMDAFEAFFEEHKGSIELEKLIQIVFLSITNDFQFVEIALSHDDDPQVIFETLNGRGAPLTETDLIRNYIFMRAEANGEDLDNIYTQYWDEYDDRNLPYPWHSNMTRGRISASRLQFFVVDYLIGKIKDEVRYEHVFYHYKSYIVHNSPFKSVKDELEELHKYSKTFKTITNPLGNSILEKLAQRLIIMDVTTVFPLILYVDGRKDISQPDKERLYGFLDSYLIRRFICGLTTKAYNKVFLDMIKVLAEDSSIDGFATYLQAKTADTNLWPDDNLLAEKIKTRPIYSEEKGKARLLINILVEVEYYQRGKKQENIKIDSSNLTVEHVMPQNWQEHWLLDGVQVSEEDFNESHHRIYGEEDQNGLYHKVEQRKIALQTFGNLTLLTSSLNPSVSNDSFANKKPEMDLHSLLKLNSYFQSLSTWDESEIQKRGATLSKAICSIWAYPQKS